LNDAGRAQARALANALAGEKIRSVTTSDLGRARETAEIVAAALGLGPPVADGDLRERRFGIFEGLTRDECRTRHPEAWQSWLAQTEAPAGAEPRTEAIARMTRALARAAGDEPALIVSHGGVIRLFLMELLGPNVPLIANGMVYVVEGDASRFRARLWERA
jgi:probable phosphoglycerate mutase